MPTMCESSLDLTLIIPALNEASIIQRTLDELKQYVEDELPTKTCEILVVDDGSTDGMATIVEEMVRTDSSIQLVSHRHNMGRGRAIRTGFENARGRFVICLDADLSYAPWHILKLLEPLETDQADITLASAYHPDGKVENVPFSRAKMSLWGNRVLSAGVYGKLNTVTCIVRGYNRHALETMELVSDGKDLHLEIIQKATLFGLRLKEIPAHLKWRDRQRGKSKKSGLLSRIPFLAMSSTITSHLVYNYVLRPGSILLVPVLGLMLFTVVGMLTLVLTWFYKFAFDPGGLGLGKLYVTFRDTLLNGSLTLTLVVAAALTSLIFIAFYFASQQSKKNFEELYVLVSRMNNRVKDLEKKLGA
jgi:glycosyltransferase involved in cell wall biosynthesis